jgi:hypothetical protein
MHPTVRKYLLKLLAIAVVRARTERDAALAELDAVRAERDTALERIECIRACIEE